jgi:regulatory protein
VKPPKNLHPKNEVDRQKLINKALKLLSYRPRSISEIKFRLTRLKYSTPALINQTIEYLLETNLLDDQKFASWWVEQRSTHRPKGNIALTSELLSKGIDQSIIESVLLSSENEKKLAQKILKSKKTTNRPLAYQYLYSRGFSSNTINASIDELSL